MAKKIVFVGRQIHIRTGSDLFFLEILRELGDVSVVRRGEIPKEEIGPAVRSYSPDLVVFFQLKPTWEDMAKPFFGPKKVWVPMWDGFQWLSLRRRLGHRLFGVQAVSFAQRVHDHFKRYGLPSLRVRYFPKPNLEHASSKEGPPYVVFLWQRDPKINLELIAKLFPPGTVQKVIFKTDLAVPPLESLPFAVELLEGWLPKDKLIQRIQEADYYIAPRGREGIGFSFLEAMALGKVVVGHNQGTMNEYISDGVNGQLFQGGERLSTHWPSPADLQPKIAQYCHDAYANWIRDRQRLKEFLQDLIK